MIVIEDIDRKQLIWYGHKQNGVDMKRKVEDSRKHGSGGYRTSHETKKPRGRINGKTGDTIV